MISPALFFNQIAGRKEVQFDWAKFSWIGSPEETVDTLVMRSGNSYDTLDEIRKATVPPKCGATGPGTLSHYLPRLLDEVLGLKFNVITGYPGAPEIDLALERGEIHCRAVTRSAIMGRDPGRAWVKTGFVRLLVVGSEKRDPKAPGVPTIWELMEKDKTPEIGKRVATLVLSPTAFGRPFMGGPGMPSDRVKIVRDSFMKTMNDPELLAEVEKRGWEASPVRGEKLEALAREVVTQPPEVINRMNVVLGK